MRTRKAPEERKAEILTTATELINQVGYQKVSMVDISNKIGISKAALYVYFPAKDALLEAVIFKSLEAPLAAIKHASNEPGNVSQKLINMLSDSFSLALYKPKHMVELINSSRSYAQNILREHTEKSLALYTAVLEDAQQRGEISLINLDIELEDAAKLILSCGHGAALGTNIGSSILPQDLMRERISALVNSLIYGWNNKSTQ